MNWAIGYVITALLIFGVVRQRNPKDKDFEAVVITAMLFPAAIIVLVGHAIGRLIEKAVERIEWRDK